MIIMNELRHAQHTHLIHIQTYEIMFYISITSPFELKNKKNELWKSDSKNYLFYRWLWYHSILFSVVVACSSAFDVFYGIPFTDIKGF